MKKKIEGLTKDIIRYVGFPYQKYYPLRSRTHMPMAEYISEEYNSISMARLNASFT